MGKTKKFPKNGSSKFVLLYRSQQDADYGKEGASELVLYPVGKPGSKNEERAEASEPPLVGSDHINSLGLPNDGYNYEKHFRSISGGGTFVGRNGKASSAPVLPPEALPSTEQENDRMLEAITISDSVMDPDIRDALFNPDFDNGELWDDFVTRASAPVEGEEEEGFDYDAHIASLVAASEKQLSLAEPEGGESEVNSEVDSLADASASVAESSSGLGEIQRAQVEREFEKTLEEYDSDECGSLEDPEDDPSMRGHIELDSENLDALMDAYLERQKEEQTFNPRENPFPQSAVAEQGQDKNTLVKDTSVEPSTGAPLDSSLGPAVQNECSETPGKEDETAEESGDSGAEDYMPDYLKEKEEPRWDCESIISTYSNLDNHPVRINEPRRAARRKKGSSTVGTNSESEGPSCEAPKRIILSEKSGLPIGVLPRKTVSNDSDEEIEKHNKGEARKQNETKEEKKARKMAVKLERKNRRETKSASKEAHKAEAAVELQRAAHAPGGVSVFRY